jgi:glutamate N-acetyltransferase/amino-acid N-acetyltransferase
MEDAQATANEVATALGISPQDVLVSSTGVIGVPLPMEKLIPGVRAAIAELPNAKGGEFSEAIMTTDLVEKTVFLEFPLGGKPCHMAGVAKGSGMIHPNMATMLSFLATDVAIDSDLLDAALRDAVGGSFNQISVDGDTSTNDTVAVFANGVAENPRIRTKGRDYYVFREALTQACTVLAKKVARDGEGATCLIEVVVRGARSLDDARKAARTIVSSPLVKTAVHGRDPNWGRIIAAAGRSGADVNHADFTVRFAGEGRSVEVVKHGEPLPFDKDAARGILALDPVILELDLHLGSHEARAWGCDLTHGYVDINAHYTT